MAQAEETSRLATSSPQSWQKIAPVKEPFKIRIPKLAIALLVLGLIAGGAYVAMQQMNVTRRQEMRRNLPTAVVERENLPVTIAANGTIQPERSVNLSPKNSGVLKQLLVKEGDRVQQGQILAYMDDSNLQGELTQAKGQIASAQANLQRLQAGNRPQDIGQAEAKLREAQANLQRLQAGNRPEDIAKAQADVQKNEALIVQAQSRLDLASSVVKRLQVPVREGAVSRDRLDDALTEERNARDNLQQAKATLTVAKQELALQNNGFRPEEIAQARAQVEQAQQALSLQKAGTRPEEIEAARAQVITAEGSMQTVRSRIDDTVIRAPFSGTVTRKFADPGSFVTPTTSGSSVSSATSSSILALASKNQIVAKVAETNISQIKVGQKVKIQADAYPEKTFSGEVTQIAVQSTIEQNVTNFEVKMSISDPENLLRAGMNVNVDFQVGMLNDALVIPTVAIVRQENGTGVMVLPQEGENRRPRFRAITTGVTVGNKTVVRSGLEEGDRILLSMPAGARRSPNSNSPSIFPMGGMGGGGMGGGGRRGNR